MLNPSLLERFRSAVIWGAVNAAVKIVWGLPPTSTSTKTYPLEFPLAVSAPLKTGVVS